MTKEDDAELFRQAMRHIKPLVPADKTFIKQPIKHQARQGNTVYRRQQTQLTTPERKTSISVKQILSPNDQLAYAQAGLASDQYRRLKNGLIPIEAKLDLHGYTIDNGLLAMEHFFNLARERQYRCLKIIHGKGRDEQAPIKNAVFSFLQAQSDILAFHSAPPKLGGTGVVLILLKR